MAARRTVISFAPIVALSTLVALLLQLNGVLLLWKIQQKRQISAIRAGLLQKKSYFYRNVKRMKQRNLNRKNEVVGTNPVELTYGGKTSGRE